MSHDALGPDGTCHALLVQFGTEPVPFEGATDVHNGGQDGWNKSLGERLAGGGCPEIRTTPYAAHIPIPRGQIGATVKKVVDRAHAKWF